MSLESQIPLFLAMPPNLHQKNSRDFVKCLWWSTYQLPLTNPRSSNQEEWFMNTFKRALKKSNGGSTEATLQQFLQVYWLTPNENVPLAITPAEIMFAWKIRTVFGKLIPNKKKS